MSGLHKRKSLKSLLQEAKDKMTQAPEHIKAAQVLAEMQEDLHEKMSGGTDRGDRPGDMSGVNDRGAPSEQAASGSQSAVETPSRHVRVKPVPFPVPVSEPIEETQNNPVPCAPSAEKDAEKRPGVLSGVFVRGECPGVLPGVDAAVQLQAPPRETAADQAQAAVLTAPGKRRPGRKGVKEILPRRPRISGERQKQLYAWLREQGGAVRTTLSVLTEMTGIEDRSLRRILTDWEANGIVQKQSGQFGVELRLLIDDQPAPPRKAAPKPRQGTLTGLELADVCPNLHAAGFTEVHLKRITAALTKQDIDTSHVWTGLRYAEWELANGKMVDKTGGPIASPVDWVYKSLISDGTYRIPKGYVSPTEKLRRQAEEELAREREALETLERLRAEKEELELQKQIETLLAQVLADTQSQLARPFLEPLPKFLRELGAENPLFQRACRVQIEWHLRQLAGKEEK